MEKRRHDKIKSASIIHSGGGSEDDDTAAYLDGVRLFRITMVILCVQW
jgi:hypothetical protein